jgi:hypothetical protein
MLKILKSVANDLGGKAKRFRKVLNISGQNEATLMESCRKLNGRKAVGTDGVTKEEYVRNLGKNGTIREIEARQLQSETK